MQAEIQTKVKISVSEIKKILAEKFCLYHDFEVEIVGDSVVESETVEQDNEGWIFVPENWNKPFCPTKFEEHCLLDVEFKQGYQCCNVLALEYWNAWMQEGSSWDIVKYRVSKQTN